MSGWYGTRTAGVRKVIEMSYHSNADLRKAFRGRNIMTIEKQKLRDILEGLSQEAQDPSVSAVVNLLAPDATRPVIADTLWSVLVFTGRVL